MIDKISNTRSVLYQAESGRRLVEAQRQVGFLARKIRAEGPKQHEASELLELAQKNGVLGSRRPAILAAAALGAAKGISVGTFVDMDPPDQKLQMISRHAGNLDIEVLAGETYKFELLSAGLLRQNKANPKAL